MRIALRIALRIGSVSHARNVYWAARAYFGMSSESKGQESKVWECPECGKAYLRQESLAAHLKSHKSDKNNYVTREEFADFINTLKMGLQGTAYYAAPPASAGSAATTSATQGGPPPLRLGHFIVKEKPEGTADIICPHCGVAELDRPLPQKVVEKVEKEEVEVVPPGYIPAPKGAEDWLRILSLKHADGRGPEECPDCAKTLLGWFNQNRSKLERAARVAK